MKMTSFAISIKQALYLWKHNWLCLLALFYYVGFPFLTKNKILIYLPSFLEIEMIHYLSEAKAGDNAHTNLLNIEGTQIYMDSLTDVSVFKAAQPFVETYVGLAE